MSNLEDDKTERLDIQPQVESQKPLQNEAIDATNSRIDTSTSVANSQPNRCSDTTETVISTEPLANFGATHSRSSAVGLLDTAVVSTLGPLPEGQTTRTPICTAPPSYTSVEMRRTSFPFVPPAPPPSYGEVMNIRSLISPRPPLILNVAPSVWTQTAQPAYCRNCHTVVISKIKHQPCTFTHLAAALLFIFLCWPLCILPYCISNCQQTKHSCPSCNQVLGVYRPRI